MKYIRKNYIILICTLCIKVGLYSQTNQYLDKAIAAEKWLQSVEQKDSTGIFWPNIKDSAFVSNDLYAGNVGVVLFYLELYQATKNYSYLQKIKQGINYILANQPDTLFPLNCGLYSGYAGSVYLLHQAYIVSHDPEYLRHSKIALAKLKKMLLLKQVSMELANDIVYGYSGIGLVFLYAHKHKLIDEALQTAKIIGDTLLNRCQSKRWPMFMSDINEKFYMPNFSHGTAGIAYYLAKLYQVSSDKRYLLAATTSAEYLLSIANTNGLIYHAEPDTAAMHSYYLGYCHGPVGTARLYYTLHQISGDNKWQMALDKSISYVMNCGIPKKRLPGYWDNVSQCCGNAGIATFYMQLYQRYKKKEYLQFSEIMAANLLERSSSTDGGINWPQAENRKQPGFIQVQTGFMQGSAGIGIMLLQLDAVKKNKPYLIKLPDNPF
jgi:lantibiotic modifying enzyme